MSAGTVFGEAAEAYDAGRPGYHPELVAEVLAYAEPPCRTAVECGAGTGKATVLFAAGGLAVTAVEPDARMAGVLRRTTAGFPGVEVEVAAFETWPPGDRRFDLLLAATSWHWVDPVRGWDVAAGVLRPGGTVALVWNPQGVVDPDLHAALRAVDTRHGISDAPHAKLATAYGDRPSDWADAAVPWPAAACRDDGRFGGFHELRLREHTRYGTGRYAQFLASVSTYRRLTADRRDRVLAETAAVLDAHGGGIDMLHLTDVFLARRQASQPGRISPAS